MELQSTDTNIRGTKKCRISVWFRAPRDNQCRHISWINNLSSFNYTKARLQDAFRVAKLYSGDDDLCAVIHFVLLTLTNHKLYQEMRSEYLLKKEKKAKEPSRSTALIKRCRCKGLLLLKEVEKKRNRKGTRDTKNTGWKEGMNYDNNR